MTNYKILQAKTIKELEQQVRDFLSDGWQVAGSMAVSPIRQRFYQAGEASLFEQGFTFYQAIIREFPEVSDWGQWYDVLVYHFHEHDYIKRMYTIDMKFKVWETDEIDDYKAGLEFARKQLDCAKTSGLQTFWRQRVKHIENMLQQYSEENKRYPYPHPGCDNEQ